ncbi:thiamine biosynthesis protein ThiF [Sulfurimonas paralvinellae]|uniref:Thiamine biosynthesis protein ThiF n=1 Tax=Sulfurimonas paralvinellae TaxID=317658 RepID=A0A7M1B643_9BACT|nr:thiamine biosynthesis protein ThiF [Sulfurimonas paralvinellae]QOP45197.1 thiamine biosynthesis protein ThiF [Sulfurimonas paralvinellae]
MTHGFDLNSPLVCEGIIGDGCGGGRLFIIEEDILFAYDPLTQEKIVLLREIRNAQEISKIGCVITIRTKENILYFDLSLLSLVEKA